MKASEILSRDEIQDLMKTSDARGFFALCTTWGMIAGSFLLVANFPAWWSFLIALIILGGRHLALAILMHDAAHYSLFKTKWMNDFFGSWFAAYPTWQHLGRYRPHHLKHHKFAGSSEDPDLDLVENFPLPKKSLIRKFIRDLTGVTGVKRIFGLLLMDFGFIDYSVSSRVQRLHPKGVKTILLNGLKNLHGVVITNFVLFSFLKLLGHPSLYLLWIISYLTTFSFFVRIRSIAEHACTDMDLNPLRNTRTTYAPFLARITVAPHFVNYHLEHHLLMTVPHQNFRKMHELLLKRGVFDKGFLSRSYTDVLKESVI